MQGCSLQLSVRGKPSAFDISTENDLAVVASPGCMTFFHMSSLGSPRHVVHYEQPQQVRQIKFQNFGPNIAALRGGIISLWDPSKTMRPLLGFIQSSGWITDMSWHLSNMSILATSSDASAGVAVWDMRSPSYPMLHMAAGQISGSVDWCPDNSNLLAAISDGQRVLVWDVRMVGGGGVLSTAHSTGQSRVDCYATIDSDRDGVMKAYWSRGEGESNGRSSIVLGTVAGALQWWSLDPAATNGAGGAQSVVTCKKEGTTAKGLIDAASIVLCAPLGKGLVTCTRSVSPSSNQPKSGTSVNAAVESLLSSATDPNSSIGRRDSNRRSQSEDSTEHTASATNAFAYSIDVTFRGPPRSGNKLIRAFIPPSDYTNDDDSSAESNDGPTVHVATCREPILGIRWGTAGSLLPPVHPGLELLMMSESAMLHAVRIPIETVRYCSGITKSGKGSGAGVSSKGISSAATASRAPSLLSAGAITNNNEAAVDTVVLGGNTLAVPTSSSSISGPSAELLPSSNPAICAATSVQNDTRSGINQHTNSKGPVYSLRKTVSTIGRSSVDNSMLNSRISTPRPGGSMSEQWGARSDFGTVLQEEILHLEEALQKGQLEGLNFGRLDLYARQISLEITRMAPSPASPLGGFQSSGETGRGAAAVENTVTLIISFPPRFPTQGYPSFTLRGAELGIATTALIAELNLVARQSCSRLSTTHSVQNLAALASQLDPSSTGGTTSPLKYTQFAPLQKTMSQVGPDKLNTASSREMSTAYYGGNAVGTNALIGALNKGILPHGHSGFLMDIARTFRNRIFQTWQLHEYAFSSRVPAATGSGNEATENSSGLSLSSQLLTPGSGMVDVDGNLIPSLMSVGTSLGTEGMISGSSSSLDGDAALAAAAAMAAETDVIDPLAYRVPCPRSSGATFSSLGVLVCFGGARLRIAPVDRDRDYLHALTSSGASVANPTGGTQLLSGSAAVGSSGGPSTSANMSANMSAQPLLHSNASAATAIHSHGNQSVVAIFPYPKTLADLLVAERMLREQQAMEAMERAAAEEERIAARLAPEAMLLSRSGHGSSRNGPNNQTSTRGGSGRRSSRDKSRDSDNAGDYDYDNSGETSSVSEDDDDDDADSPLSESDEGSLADDGASPRSAAGGLLEAEYLSAAGMTAAPMDEVNPRMFLLAPSQGGAGVGQGSGANAVGAGVGAGGPPILGQSTTVTAAGLASRGAGAAIGGSVAGTLHEVGGSTASLSSHGSNVANSTAISTQRPFLTNSRSGPLGSGGSVSGSSIGDVTPRHHHHHLQNHHHRHHHRIPSGASQGSAATADSAAAGGTGTSTTAAIMGTSMRSMLSTGLPASASVASRESGFNVRGSLAGQGQGQGQGQSQGQGLGDTNSFTSQAPTSGKYSNSSSGQSRYKGSRSGRISTPKGVYGAPSTSGVIGLVPSLPFLDPMSGQPGAVPLGSSSVESSDGDSPRVSSAYFGGGPSGILPLSIAHQKDTLEMLGATLDMEMEFGSDSAGSPRPLAGEYTYGLKSGVQWPEATPTRASIGASSRPTQVFFYQVTDSRAQLLAFRYSLGPLPRCDPCDLDCVASMELWRERATACRYNASVVSNVEATIHSRRTNRNNRNSNSQTSAVAKVFDRNIGCCPGGAGSGSMRAVQQMWNLLASSLDVMTISARVFEAATSVSGDPCLNHSSSSGKKDSAAEYVTTSRDGINATRRGGSAVSATGGIGGRSSGDGDGGSDIMPGNSAKSTGHDAGSGMNWNTSALGRSLLIRCINQLRANGDVQTLATVVCIMGGSAQLSALIQPPENRQEACEIVSAAFSRVRLSQPFPSEEIERHLLNYAEILRRWSALLQAAEVTKHLGGDSIRREAAPSSYSFSMSSPTKVTGNVRDFGGDGDDALLAGDLSVSRVIIGVNCPWCGGVSTSDSCCDASGRVRDDADAKQATYSSIVSVGSVAGGATMLKGSTVVGNGNGNGNGNSAAGISSGGNNMVLPSSTEREIDANKCAVLRCGPCGSYALHCAICQMAVRGSGYFCIKCGHGGHAEHMREWFQRRGDCAVGCGCHCGELAVQGAGTATGTGSASESGRGSLSPRYSMQYPGDYDSKYSKRGHEHVQGHGQKHGQKQGQGPGQKQKGQSTVADRLWRQGAEWTQGASDDDDNDDDEDDDEDEEDEEVDDENMEYGSSGHAMVSSAGDGGGFGGGGAGGRGGRGGRGRSRGVIEMTSTGDAADDEFGRSDDSAEIQGGGRGGAGTGEGAALSLEDSQDSNEYRGDWQGKYSRTSYSSEEEEEEDMSDFDEEDEEEDAEDEGEDEEDEEVERGGAGVSSGGQPATSVYHHRDDLDTFESFQHGWEDDE